MATTFIQKYQFLMPESNHFTGLVVELINGFSRHDLEQIKAANLTFFLLAFADFVFQDVFFFKKYLPELIEHWHVIEKAFVKE